MPAVAVAVPAVLVPVMRAVAVPTVRVHAMAMAVPAVAVPAMPAVAVAVAAVAVPAMSVAAVPATPAVAVPDMPAARAVPVESTYVHCMANCTRRGRYQTHVTTLHGLNLE